jgi:LppX/LprAFG-like lipoprotein
MIFSKLCDFSADNSSRFSPGVRMRTAHRAAVLMLCVLVPSVSVDGFGQQPADAKGAVQVQLNRAADAVLALKSARFSVQREGPPAMLDEKNGITFTLAECVYAAPDRVSCDVKVTLKNGTVLLLTRVWVPEGTFQSNPLTRQFGRAPADSTFNGVLLFAKTGIPDIMRTGVQNAQVVGKERVLSRDTLHLKGDVSGARLMPFISSVRPDLTYAVDLWLDEKTETPLQLHVTEPDSAGWQIELSRINEPVDIPTPQVPPAPGKPQA